MKAPMLGLIVAATTFAGSSAYLWKQLQQERSRSAQLQEAAQRLDRRVAELEHARAQWGQRHLASADDTGAEKPARVAATRNPEPSSDAPAAERPPRPEWNMRRAEPSPVMLKMMRTQMRANNKRLYADLAAKLGLTSEAADSLVDLLTDQQLAIFEKVRQTGNEAEARQALENQQRENQQAITDLIGADKAMELQEYQKSMPARQEFQMLSRQLENTGVALSDEQSRQLLAIYVDERARVPEPQYADGMDSAEYATSLRAWQDEYANRVNEQVGRVLNSNQLATYNEIQQWQKEMRDQFGTAPAPRGARAMFMGGGGISIAAPVSPPGPAANVSTAPATQGKP